MLQLSISFSPHKTHLEDSCPRLPCPLLIFLNYRARKKDKLRYRYPRGESYLDVIQRLALVQFWNIVFTCGFFVVDIFINLNSTPQMQARARNYWTWTTTSTCCGDISPGHHLFQSLLIRFSNILLENYCWVFAFLCYCRRCWGPYMLTLLIGLLKKFPISR